MKTHNVLQQFNPLPNNKILDWSKLKQKSAFKMENKCHMGWKLWEEKLLVTSDFSFSHNVFYSYISLERQNVVLCGNGLNIFI